MSVFRSGNLGWVGGSGDNLLNFQSLATGVHVPVRVPGRPPGGVPPGRVRARRGLQQLAGLLQLPVRGPVQEGLLRHQRRLQAQEPR